MRRGNNLNPLRFNRDDLIEIIHDFAKFIKNANAQTRVESLRHLGLEDKNRINGISEAYFARPYTPSVEGWTSINSPT